jgi:hypothetical protein
MTAIRCIDYAVSNGYPYYVDLSESNSLYTDTASQNGDKNIWNYFFKQPAKPENSAANIYCSPKYEGDATRIWSRSHFKKVYNSAVKHVAFTAPVAEAFAKAKASIPQGTLGVHIRKTDHYIEVPSVPISDYIKIIGKKLAQNNYKNLFIATDDTNALAEIKSHFAGINIYSNDVTRSSNGEPLHKHYNENKGFDLGLEALLDVYSLSLCSEVILSNSNFSYCVLYFNPTLKYSLIDGLSYNKSKMYHVVNTADNFRFQMRYLFYNNAVLMNYYRKWKLMKLKLGKNKR